LGLVIRTIIQKILLVLIIPVVSYSQSVKLLPEPGFVPYVTYYVSSIDLTTGTTDVLLFRFRLAEESGDYGVNGVFVKIEFEMTVKSPALGISNETTVLKVNTDPFQLFNDILIDNRDLTTETTAIYDMDGNEVQIGVHIIDQLDISEYENLLNSVITRGKLPDGEYTFRIGIQTGNTQSSLSETDMETEKIIVTSPTSINLISPGGALEDTSTNLVYTIYPVFQWETEPCSNCESFIRVAKFIPSDHTSLDEAIEDVTTLPIDQTRGWEPVGVTTTFPYPADGTIDLEFGKIYVWQIRKDLPTTEGINTYMSPIWAFKIAEYFVKEEIKYETFHPVLQQLRDVLDEEKFNSYFGSNGSLVGFTPTGDYIIDGVNVPSDAVLQLLGEIAEKKATLLNVTIE